MNYASKHRLIEKLEGIFTNTNHIVVCELPNLIKLNSNKSRKYEKIRAILELANSLKKEK